jgi:hypothetical protein
VVGCPDINVTQDATFKRTSTGAVIGCVSRGDIWRLTCQNNRWIGRYGNCSDGQHIYVSEPTRIKVSFIFHATPLPPTLPRARHELFCCHTPVIGPIHDERLAGGTRGRSILLRKHLITLLQRIR